MNTTYLLDASALIADPKIADGLDGQIIVPVSVLDALRQVSKSAGPKSGRAVRALAELDEATAVNNARIRFESNHQEARSELRAVTNKRWRRLLTVALNLGGAVIVTNDQALAMTCRAFDIDAKPTFDANELRSLDTFTVAGVPSVIIDELFDQGFIDCDLPPNRFINYRAGQQSALAITDGTQASVLDSAALARRMFGIKLLNSRQIAAAAALSADTVTAVSIGGPAGSGKTLLALAAGLHGVVEDRRYDRIMVLRPIEYVGRNSLGYLPGDEDDKLAPWREAIFDAGKAICGASWDDIYHELVDRGQLEIGHIGHLRGRTLARTFVVLDEAQNFEFDDLRTVLSRIGEGSKIVLTHDVTQRDNRHVSKRDGVARVASLLLASESPMFAHIELDRVERSTFSALVNTALGGGGL